MKFRLRNVIVVAIWLAATVFTIKIVTGGAGAEGDDNYWVIDGLGVLAVLASSMALLWAMGNWNKCRYIAFAGCIVMWAAANAFVLPNEVTFWSAHIVHLMHKQQDLQQVASDKRAALDRVRETIKANKPLRSAKEIDALIDGALARPIAVGRGEKSLAALTAACTDKASPSYKLCGEVQQLRAEAERSKRYEAKEDLLWNAGTAVTEGAEAHGVYDGVAWLGRQSGELPDAWSDRMMLTGVVLLMFLRDWILYVGLDDGEKVPVRRSAVRGDREAEKAALTPALSPALPLAITHDPKKEAPVARRAPRRTTKAIALADPKVVSLSQRRAANDEKKTQPEPVPLDDIVEEAVSVIGPREVDYQTIREAVLEAAKLRGWTKLPSNPEIGASIKKRNHPSTRPYRKDGEITKRITLYDLSSRLADVSSAEVAEA